MIIKGKISEDRLMGMFEAICDGTDNHPMTVIFTAYDRTKGGPDTDEDVPHYLTDIAQDLFDLDDSDIIDQLYIRWDDSADAQSSPEN